LIPRASRHLRCRGGREIEKLRKDAADGALIRDLAIDQVKREMYERLHRHFNSLAAEVEQAIKSSAAR